MAITFSRKFYFLLICFLIQSQIYSFQFASLKDQSVSREISFYAIPSIEDLYKMRALNKDSCRLIKNTQQHHFIKSLIINEISDYGHLNAQKIEMIIPVIKTIPVFYEIQVLKIAINNLYDFFQYNVMLKDNNKDVTTIFYDIFLTEEISYSQEHHTYLMATINLLMALLPKISPDQFLIHDHEKNQSDNEVCDITVSLDKEIKNFEQLICDLKTFDEETFDCCLYKKKRQKMHIQLKNSINHFLKCLDKKINPQPQSPQSSSFNAAIKAD